MKKKEELTMISVGKGATGKIPSYMKKLLEEKKVKINTTEITVAEEILFGEEDEKNNKSRKTD
jgi:hypothetical protein